MLREPENMRQKKSCLTPSAPIKSTYLCVEKCDYSTRKARDSAKYTWDHKRRGSSSRITCSSNSDQVYEEILQSLLKNIQLKLPFYFIISFLILSVDGILIAALKRQETLAWANTGPSLTYMQFEVEPLPVSEITLTVSN